MAKVTIQDVLNNQRKFAGSSGPGQATGANQSHEGQINYVPPTYQDPNAAPGPVPAGVGTFDRRYMDFQGGGNAADFGFSWYDPNTNTAYDQNGKPVVDDGSDPALTARLQAARDSASARKLEFGSREEAQRQLGNVQRQTAGVNAAEYGRTLPLEQEFARGRISEAAGAARDLGNPVTNQAAIDGALTEQGDAARKISIADVANVGRQNQQFDEYGGDLGSYRQDIDLLRRTATGEGPSAAQALAKIQQDDAIRSMQALAGTARGGNIAAGMRGAMQAGTDLMLRNQQQINALRAQEQLTGQAQLASAQQGLAGAQAQRAGAINTARATDVTREIGSAAAMDATTGRQLGMGELETQRQAGKAQMLGAAGQTQLEAAKTAAEIERNREDTRQSRARLALDSYNTLTNQGMAPVNRDAQQRHETAVVKRGGQLTPKDIFGGVMGAIGAGAAGLGSIFKGGA